jgi:hypothetical protein
MTLQEKLRAKLGPSPSKHITCGSDRRQRLPAGFPRGGDGRPRKLTEAEWRARLHSTMVNEQNGAGYVAAIGGSFVGGANAVGTWGTRARDEDTLGHEWEERRTATEAPLREEIDRA